MSDFLLAIASLCGASDHPIRWFQIGLVPALFLTGVAGSAMHCAPMCGPFVLGQIGDRLAAVPACRMCERRRIATGLLLPYHAGRIITYAVLGAVAGGFGAALPVTVRSARWLLVMAAVLFALQAIRRWTPHVRLGSGPARLLQRVPGSFRVRGLLLGLLLGFLPCGLLYAAITAGAGSGSALAGAASLTAFGLGTAPLLMLVGITGLVAERRIRGAVTTFAPYMLAGNATLLVLIAALS